MADDIHYHSNADGADQAPQTTTALVNTPVAAILESKRLLPTPSTSTQMQKFIAAPAHNTPSGGRSAPPPLQASAIRVITPPATGNRPLPTPPTGNRPLPMPPPPRTQQGPRSITTTEEKLKQQYAAEAIDPKHRMGDILECFVGPYERATKISIDIKNLDIDENKTAAFLAWVDGRSDRDAKYWIQNLLTTRRMGDPNHVDLYFRAFKKGVAYLDERMRKDFEVDLTNGLLYYHRARNWKWGEDENRTLGPQPLNTKMMSTVARGRGWAIWVLARKGNDHIFYTGSHQLGSFHHSSFTGGAPVLAGGEWQVTDGKLLVINGKTGHYQTDAEALRFTLQQLKRGGIPLDQTKVMLRDSVTDENVEKPANDFLVKGAEGVGVANGAANKVLNTPQRAAMIGNNRAKPARPPRPDGL